MWAAIKYLPYEVRYSLYGYWKNESPREHILLMRVKAKLLQESKYVPPPLPLAAVVMFVHAACWVVHAACWQCLLFCRPSCSLRPVVLLPSLPGVSVARGANNCLC